MKLYNSAAIREKIAAVNAEIEALIAFAESEERELTPEEKTQIDAHVNAIGVEAEGDNEATGLTNELRKAERYEQMKARLAATSNVQQPLNTPVVENNKTPAIPKRGRLRAFRSHEDAFRSAKWLKAQFLNDEESKRWLTDYGTNEVSIKNVQTTKADPDGGFITPDPMSSAVLDAMDIYGATPTLARRIPMSSNSLTIPRRDGGLTVYYPGEAVAITASDKSWTQTKLTADIRATLTKVSLTLQDAAAIGVMDDLAMEIGRALGIQMDNELINGNGTATYGGVNGLTQASNISTTATGNLFSEAVLADFSGVVGALPQKFHANASWLMSRAGYAESAERLAYAAGGNTTANIASGEGRGSAGTSGRTFLGYPVVFSDQMPAEANSAVAAYFGDFNYGVILGEFGNVQIDISNERYFEEGNSAIRGMYSYDLVVTDASSTGAFSRLVLAAS